MSAAERDRRQWQPLGMVGVAQLVERRLVVADVAGSSPVTHPHVRGQVPPNWGALAHACFIACHYVEDWTALWWVRVDGNARIVPVGSTEGTAGVAALVAKYPHYQAEPPPGPVVVIAVAGWSSWSAR